MVAPVPDLSPADVAGKLEELFSVERNHFVFALHGTGSPDKVTVEKAPRPVEVIPVTSELELRRRLLDLPDEACAAFLVPFDGDLPMDLRFRFARNGRVLPVGSRARLRGLFGAVEIAPELHGHPLVDYLLAHHGNERWTSRGALTEDVLWRAWLGRAWNLGAGSELALDVLVGWAALDGRGPTFVRTLEDRGAGAVREALLDYLGKRLGPAGPAVWRAWELGRGAEAMQMAILAAATDGVEDGGVRVWWQMLTEKIFGEVDPAALARLGQISEAALRHVQSQSGSTAVARLVADADERLIDPVKPHLAGSPRLPSAWQARLAELGRALAEGAAAPTREAARRASELRARLGGHMMASEGEQRRTLERADMAVRLLSWLALRPDRELVRQPTPYAEVECLARWYASEGGYVDLARRRARSSDDGPLSEGVNAVLAAADRAREELDESFARALPAYVEARRPQAHCLPIDQAIERIGKRFLEGRPERRLLVLLMDGMAWAQAVEILGGLGEETVAWGPLAWHATAKHRLGEAPYPPVLANLPTVTEISRAALFAGKPMAPGPQTSSDDPKRWRANKTAAAFSDEREGPKLFLRGEGQTRDGSASSEALSLVADTRHRIVGIVLNAIDSSLKADPSQRVDWRADTIKSLRDLLDRAREVGRTVLLCSDHGHVPADRLQPAGPASSGGARWRVWDKAEDPVAEFEVGFPANPKAGVWAPRGAHGVVLLADDSRRYGGSPTAGEHGGASLAEVIAPCLLIGSEDHQEIGRDPELAVRPLVVPGWWYFDLGGEPASEPVRERKRPRKKPTDSQLTLPAVAPAKPRPETAPRPARSGAREPDMGSPLARSKVFQARAPAGERKRVLAAVEFLLERGDRASAGAFAQAIGDFASRVPGAVSKLQGVLNADGYQVIQYDRATKEVRLDRHKLATIFGVVL